MGDQLAIQNALYDTNAKERITASTPRSKEDRIFLRESQAYKWTNECLVELRTDLHLNLGGRRMLLIACSGDPIGTFAALGAGEQVAFDTSHKAVLWSELKTRAIETWPWESFCAYFNLPCTKSPKDKPSYEQLRPNLSDYAKSVFDELVLGKEHPPYNNEAFFRQSYTGAFPQSNLYSTTEAEYNKARATLKSKSTLFVPGTLEDALKASPGPYGAFYASNALDHFRNKKGERDESKQLSAPFIEYIHKNLIKHGIMIFQFEWSQKVKDNAVSTLKKLGYAVEHATGNATGYGKLTVARR